MDANLETIASVLSQLKNDDADATRVSIVVVEKMQAIHSVLAPIIGEGGVSALYKRSLFLMSRDAPWAESLYVENGTEDDYAALKSVLSQQADVDALRGAEALFANIFTVLVGLIGKALTERLLQPMYNISPSGHAVQENLS